MKEKLLTRPKHRQLASTLFNQTWEFLDKTRDESENQQMLLCAYASCYHWSQCGAELEQARGEWLISRVHSVLHQGEAALWHAERSLKICLENKIGGFDLAFAYEAIARAYATSGRFPESHTVAAQAREAAENIAEVEDKAYTLGEINTIPKE